MVYIVAGATGVVGTAISKELASENDVIIIGSCLLYTSDAADE